MYVECTNEGKLRAVSSINYVVSFISWLFLMSFFRFVITSSEESALDFDLRLSLTDLLRGWLPHLSTDGGEQAVQFLTQGNKSALAAFFR